MRSLLALMLLIVPAEAYAVPAPPQCPWMFGFVDPLQPITGDGLAPNSSIWLRDYGSHTFAVFDADRDVEVESEETRTLLTATQGALVQLRPLAGFRTGARYEVRSDAVNPGPLVVDTATDTEAPAPPVVTATRNITSPYDLCATAGIIFEVTPPDEPVIELLEDASSGALLENRRGLSRDLSEPDGARAREHASVRAGGGDGSGRQSLGGDRHVHARFGEHPRDPGPAGRRTARR